MNIIQSNIEIKLFYEKSSNSSNRVKWALDYKNINYQLCNIDTININDYKKINPMLRIPGMLINNIPLSESMAMVEMIEELFPFNSLFPENIILRAKVREVCEIVNSTIHPIQNSKVPLFFIPSLNKDEVKVYRIKWIRNNIDKLMSLLFLKSDFCVGESFTLADIFVMCIYYKALEMGLENNIFPLLNKHIEYCLSFNQIKMSCPIDELK